jgi:hypothetical protein
MHHLIRMEEHGRIFTGVLNPQSTEPSKWTRIAFMYHHVEKLCDSVIVTRQVLVGFRLSRGILGVAVSAPIIHQTATRNAVNLVLGCESLWMMYNGWPNDFRKGVWSVTPLLRRAMIGCVWCQPRSATHLTMRGQDDASKCRG